jgi:hemerythrin
MVLMEWTDRLTTGIPAMDQQHRQFIDLINQLDQAVRVSVRNPAIPNVLSKLAQCTNGHFEKEEILMQETGFVGLEGHHAVHQKLLRAVTEVMERVGAGKLSASANMAAFLRFWLEKHIADYDRQYAQLIADLKPVGMAK